MGKMLCYIAAGASGGQSGPSAKALHDQLLLALEKGLKPHPLHSEVLRVALELPNSTTQSVKALGAQLGLAPGRVVGGLLLALEVANKTGGNPAGSPVTSGLKPAQQSAVSAAAPLLAEGKWVLMEAGTGTGKSRIAAHLAAHVLALRDAGHDFHLVHESTATEHAAFPGKSDCGNAASSKVVIIAAPTVENVIHLLSEFELARPHIDQQRCWKIGVALGRNQFVSESAVTEILAQQATPDIGVLRWLELGMPPGTTAGSKVLAGSLPGICGLADDLRSVATDFPVEDVLLSEDSPESEQAWYLNLREMAMTCDVVLTTHAMLAVDNLWLQRRLPSLLPSPISLILDEAHAFEATQAMMGTDGLAVTRLIAILKSAPWAQVRAKGLADRALRDAELVDLALRTLPSNIPLPSHRIEDQACRSAWEKCRPILKKLRCSLDELKGKLTSAPAPLRSAAVFVRKAVSALIGLEDGYTGAITFSAIRKYPHIVIGPRSVDKLLASRWDNTPCGVLMSGTLLYPSLSGPVAGPLITRLKLPSDRSVATPPIHPYWLRSTPTMHVPAECSVDAFAPPTGGALTDDALRVWLGAVAELIVHDVAKHAAGGTLVLMTGYDRLRILSELLDAPLGERLITQDACQLPLTQAKAAFVSASRAGMRPVWLATGGAGTGLDLRDMQVIDVNAIQDRLLTDLVIPALPFGINRGSTQLARSDWAGFVSEKQEALRTFQQWLGRLVRREGLSDRNLWVMDGRIYQPSCRAWTHEFLRIVQDYPKFKRVDILERSFGQTDYVIGTE